MKSYRFSMAWSRIFPTGFESEPNEEGLKFYEDVIDELLKYGIEPEEQSTTSMYPKH